MSDKPKAASSTLAKIPRMALPGSLSQAAVEVVLVLMAQREVSGNKLAQLAGLPQTSLARLLRGYGNVTLDDLDVIATALGSNLPGLVHEIIKKHATFG